MKNLKELRELRTQEKTIKSRIESTMPLAVEEAKPLCPDGGKFTVDGVGDFVLDKEPVTNILTGHSPEAVAYRQLIKQRAKYRREAAKLTTRMKGIYDTYKTNKKYITSYTYGLKCLGLD